MAMIWHIFLKDCRRERVMLLMYGFLLGLEWILSSPVILDDVLLFAAVAKGLNTILSLQLVMVWVLAGQVVHDDPVVNQRAFWLTRPVSRWDILAAKSLFLFLFTVVMPLTVEVMIIRDNGLAGPALPGALAALLRARMMLVLPCLLLAAMTRNFMGYALASAGCLAGQMFLLTGWGALNYYGYCFSMGWGGFFKNPRLWDGIFNASLYASLDLIRLLLLVLFGVFLVIQQFSTRRTRRTLVWAGIGAVLILLTQRLWAWDFLNTNASRWLDIANAITLKVDPDELRLQRESDSACRLSFREKEQLWLAGPITVQGLLPTQFADFLFPGSARILLPGQADLTDKDLGDPSIWRSYFMWRGDARGLRWAVPDTQIVNLPITPKQREALLRLSPEMTAQLAGRSGTLLTDVVLDINEWRLTARIPVIPGAATTLPGEGLSIAGIRMTPDGVAIVVQSKGLHDQWSGLFGQCLGGNGGRVLLRHRVSGQAFMEEVNGIQVRVRLDSPFPLVTAVPVHNAVYEIPFKSDASSPTITEEWLRDAELVLLTVDYSVGYVRKPLRVDGLRLPPEEPADYLARNGVRFDFYSTGEREFASANIYLRHPVTAFRYYKSGELESTSVFCSGLRHGPVREYYPTGELMYEYAYQQGRLEGSLRKYDRSGRLLSERNYHQGQLLESADISAP